MGLLVGVVGLGWGGDNTAIGQTHYTKKLRNVDERYHIKFSTTVPANVSTLIIGTMTANNFVLAAGINYSTGSTLSFSYTSSTTVTMGGRAHFDFQCVSCPNKLFWDYSKEEVGITTSAYITDGQWWGRNDPEGWQGPVAVRSSGTAVIVGHIYMNKAR